VGRKGMRKWEGRQVKRRADIVKGGKEIQEKAGRR